MNDKFTDDLGNEITCSNCNTTAREVYNDEDVPENWISNGARWYCSEECYEESQPWE